MKNMNSKLVQVLLFVFAYANIITAVLACGYILVKSENEDNKRAAKLALFVSAIFICLSALVTFFTYLLQDIAKIYVYDAMTTINGIVQILKILVFVALSVLTICGISLLKSDNEIQNKKVESNAQEKENKENFEEVKAKDVEIIAENDNEDNSLNNF